MEEEGGREEEGEREEKSDGKKSDFHESDYQCGSHSSSQPDDGITWWLQQLAESGRQLGSKGEDGTSDQLREDQQPVLVLYSQQTPEEDVECIHDSLVGELRHYNIRAWTPGTAPPRLLDRQWVEQGLRAEQAVLLICNREFDWEWQLPSEGGEFHIASAVRVRSALR